jgi:hypothetical protein
MPTSRISPTGGNVCSAWVVAARAVLLRFDDEQERRTLSDVSQSGENGGGRRGNERS